MTKNKKKSNFLRNVKKTWTYVKECKGNLVGYDLVIIIEAIIGAILPFVSAKIILNMTDELITQLLWSAFTVFAIEIVEELVFYIKIYMKKI